MLKRWAKTTLLTASVLAMVLPYGMNPAQAQDQMMRVALFIDNGQGYRGVVPSVTLTSETGLDIEMDAPQGSAQLPESKAEAARFKTDQLQLILLETPNRADADLLAQQAAAKKIDVSIQIEGSGQKTRYRVLSGSFETYEAAKTKAQAVGQALAVNPRIIGTFRLEAGTFKNLKEAQDLEAAFESAGIPAHVALVSKKDKLSYAVWVGNELNKDALAQLTVRASAVMPTFSYKTAAGDSYVLMNRGILPGTQDVVNQYAFAPLTKLIVSAKKKNAVIGVEERDHRKYRGSIELSKHKGNLTVINELPLEEYLYGVVGAEMETGWPLEALKAQAVLARTRALGQGNKYEIAHLSDTVMEQAYYGYGREAEDIRRAVDETAGQVIRYQGKLAEALFYSNAGGMTADGTEVWGNPVPYIRSVESDDAGPLAQAKVWYRVLLNDGSTGYIRSDLIQLTGVNGQGMQTGVTNTNNLNFRNGPSTTSHKVLRTLPSGTPVTILNEELEENAYMWTRGPFTAQEITDMINASQERNKADRFTQPIQSLRVVERGPSGRVLKMEADGRPIAVSFPDAYRSIFRQGDSPLRSTRFEVIELGGQPVVAGSDLQGYPNGSGSPLLGATGNPLPGFGFSPELLVYNGTNDTNAPKQKMFLIRGYGFGHGLGVSQYGAKAMAEKGLDYRQILEYYYQDISIEQ